MIDSMKTKHGMGRVFLDKRTNIYISDFYVDGKRITTSTGVREIDPVNKPEEGKAWKIHTERWYKAHHHILEEPRQQRIRMDELFDDMERNYVNKGRKSLKTLRYELPRIKKFFGHLRARSINNAMAQEYQTERAAEGVSNSTIRRELAHVLTALNLGYRNDKVMKVPVIELPSPNAPRETFYEWKDAVLLSTHLPVELSQLPLIYFLTGWRLREILALEWNRVDFERMLIWIPGAQTKNKKDKYYPYHAGSEMEGVLKRQREYTDRVMQERDLIVRFVFHRNGRVIVDFREAWKLAHKAAAIPYRTVHDMRRSAKRALEMSGASEHYSMKVMGHQSVQVTRNYAVADMEPLRQTTGKMEEFVRRKG